MNLNMQVFQRELERRRELRRRRDERRRAELDRADDNENEDMRSEGVAMSEQEEPPGPGTGCLAASF